MRLPAQRSRRVAVLEHLVQSFQSGLRYSERRSTGCYANGVLVVRPTMSACDGASSTKACSRGSAVSTGALAAGLTC